MLNLIHSSRSEWRQTWIDMASALCMGAILMSGTIFYLEKEAEREMTTLMNHSLTAKSSQDAKPVQESETAISQLELADLKARVMYLSHRQIERENFTDVQHILLKNVLSPSGQAALSQSLYSLNSLIWQNGRLEFEALSQSAADWQALLNELNGFDRWKTAPQVVQTHRSAIQGATQGATQAPPNGQSQVAYILKAHIWGQATSASSTPTTKSAP
ncbi:hypothetical protein [Limnohabitans sp. MMS-10A-178]|uniref:hypothetical protein n=1 Tax=Limnohabitans sp. MMS-10A-178 TaxID=1835767 RepID=UPI000DD1FF0B|nr:hypothetical protein [Limnohabitans sp. MMS-10A-178]PUE16651.1 hypothetical protein B9Z32_03425 [Limnohabitans sp. MMS-10A-178]